MTDETMPRGFMTRLVHAGEAADPLTGAVGVPIYHNSTFAFDSTGDIDRLNEGEAARYIYTRYGNPTLAALEAKLADLVGAESALVTASGMASVTLAALHAAAGGGHIVAAQTLYPIARAFFRESAGDYGVGVSMVDATDLDAVREAMTRDTRAVYVETLSNPTLEVIDIAALARIAHGAGALLIVDNTFLSPALYRPLEDGADLVLHSATKYLSGHGNLLGGVIAGRAELMDGIRARSEQLGGVMSPHTAWLLLNGVKTLALRMRQHCATARAVAEVLAAHPSVERVNYPGLPGHPGHALATRLTGGPVGGVLSLRFRDHERARAAFVDALTIPFRAVSLGDVASLVWPFDEDGVIRLSVGIEDTDDLVADVTQALAAVAATLSASSITG
jgi:methionine-gamma-lyase